MKVPRDFYHHFRQLNQLNSILLGDVGRALRDSRNSHQQHSASPAADSYKRVRYDLKNVVRCFMGSVDATAYQLRQTVLKCAPKMGLKLDKDERKVLRKIRNPRGSLEKGYNYFARLLGLGLELDTSTEGWQAFDNIAETRNGFTHPNDVKDLFPIKHLGSLLPASIWYWKTMHDLLMAVNRTIGSAQELPDFPELDVPIQEMSVNIENVFDEEFFELLGEDAGRSIRYLRLASEHLESEIILAMNDAHYKSAVMGAEEQYTWRNLVRTLFSGLEGLANFTRLELEKAQNRGEVRISEAEHDSMKKGTPEQRAAATAHVWSREVGYDGVPSKKGSEWISVGKARRVRNRITHPKKISDVRIDHSITGIILDAAGWYQNEILGNVYINADKWVEKTRPSQN